MHVPRSNFDAIVADGCVYVMGGHASEESMGNCEKFDGKSWIPIHCLPKPIAAGRSKEKHKNRERQNNDKREREPTQRIPDIPHYNGTPYDQRLSGRVLDRKPRRTHAGRE
uniref:Uncharacterized protein n=1 Tax=Panagrolaimus davidi TaxID=227884 RepID=A0A914R0N8_9BILA